MKGGYGLWIKLALTLVRNRIRELNAFRNTFVLLFSFLLCQTSN